MNPAHLVGVGGALGAVARYLVGLLVESSGLDDAGFPWATFVVNVLGTFLLGVLTFGAVADDAMLLLGVGACGAFTTFSSFSFETVRTWETGRRRLAAGYAVGTLLAAGVALGLSWGLVTALAGH